MTGPAARLLGVRRRFGAGPPALDGVDLELRAGEVHALLGGNGAGKTTLMRILAGLDVPDDGVVEVGGAPVTAFTPRALRNRGVAMVQQHSTLVPTLTAGENLALARPRGWFRPRAGVVHHRVVELAERHGLPVRADVPVGELSVAEQQRLEILRALDADARLLILDEPAAVLVDAGAEALLRVCRELAADGRAVVITTHRPAEVFAGCDRVTVLRHGTVVCAGEPVAGHDRASLTRAVVGAAASAPDLLAAEPLVAGVGADAAARIELRGVALGRLEPLDLGVWAGEVVGVAGVDGNGQAELEDLLVGIAAPEQGTVRVDRTPLPVGAPRRRVARRIAYVPADRYRRALAAPLSVADNLELGRGPRGRAARTVRERRAGSALAGWDVRGAGPGVPAAALSGGNAQKLVLARELAGDPKVVIAAHPTRGLDPEAARAVTERILAAAAAGAAVVWFGAEMDELFAVSGRIVVLAGGKATAFAPPYDRVAIGRVMAGAAHPTDRDRLDAGAEPGGGGS